MKNQSLDNNMKIGIVGFGVLGKAMYTVLTKNLKRVLVYDKFLPDLQDPKLLSTCEVIFVQVPTPTPEGVQDMSALVDVMDTLTTACSQDPLIVIRSTVLPGTTKKLAMMYPHFRFVHNPEFLTEHNAVKDFESAKTLLVSGDHEDCLKVAQVFLKSTNVNSVSWHQDYRVTEMAKYMSNLMLATKVIVANEFYDACIEHGTDYKSVAEFAASVGKIGKTHINVPGFDQKRGFGGMCFPKDLQAFVTAFPQSTVLKEVLAKNLKYRGPGGA